MPLTAEETDLLLATVADARRIFGADYIKSSCVAPDRSFDRGRFEVALAAASQEMRICYAQGGYPQPESEANVNLAVKSHIISMAIFQVATTGTNMSDDKKCRMERAVEFMTSIRSHRKVPDYEAKTPVRDHVTVWADETIIEGRDLDSLF